MCNSDKYCPVYSHYRNNLLVVLAGAPMRAVDVVALEVEDVLVAAVVDLIVVTIGLTVVVA